MENKIKNKKIYFVLIIIIISITTIGIIKINNKQVEIIQLAQIEDRQSMGYLIKTKNNKLIAIDGGLKENTQNLINQINENGGAVDYWFLTHLHDDHLGAFVEIIKNTNIQINNIYVSLNDLSWYEQHESSRIEFTKEVFKTLENEKIKENVHQPELNEIIQIDGIKAEILGIKNPEITENAGNEQSMVIKFDTGKTSFLVLGDTGTQSSEKLIKTQKEKLKSDIVQVAHHGQAGATEELYKIINPQICLWPTPTWLWNNDAGSGENTGEWKTFETRKWLENLNVEKNYIGKDGNQVIEIK